MKLSASNIAWPAETSSEIYEILSSSGFTGVEVAPTKFAPWEALTDVVASEEARRLADYGLSVSSYQAILFGRPEAHLLQSEQSFAAMEDHIKVFCNFAARLSRGGTAVFGSPKNRLLHGLDQQSAFAIGRDRFRKLAEAAEPFGVTLALEPAPEFYGGDFLCSTNECATMVAAVDHASFRLHIDTGCILLEDSDLVEKVEKYSGMIQHIHLSRPGLAPFIDDGIDVKRASELLSENNYSGWYALEMRQTENPVADVKAAATLIMSSFKGLADVSAM